MKSIGLSLILVATTTFASAQRLSSGYMQLVNFNNPYVMEELSASSLHSHVHRLVREKHVKQVNEEITVKNKVVERTFRFNEAGRITQANSEDYNVKLTYKDDTLITSIIQTSGRNVTERRWFYNEDQLFSYENKNNGKIVSRIISVTSEQGLPLETAFIDQKRGKSGFMRYAYNDDNKIQEQWYYSKGKLKRHWNYDCSEEGKEVTQKGETDICTFNETNSDGSFIKYQRTLRNGQETMVKLYFKSDSTWFKTEMFNENDALIRKHERSEVSYLSESFNDKGKRTSFYKEEFDNEGKKLRSMNSWKGDSNKVHETRYSYNEQGLIDQLTTLYKGKEKRKLDYSYSYFD